MRLQVGLVGVLVALESRAFLHEVECAAHAAVEVGLGKLATLHSGDDGVELLLLARLQHVVTCPHLCGTVLTAEPVGHDSTLVAPFIAQDGLHKVFALGSIGPVDVIVRGHHRPGLAFLNGNLKTLQVDFTQGTLGDVRIVVHAVGLLVIGGKVLDARAHAVTLNTFDVGGCSLTDYQRVLTVVLEIAAAQRVAHDVHGWSQQHVGTVLLYFVADGSAHLLNEVGIPRRGKKGTDGKMGAVIGCAVTFTGGVNAQSGRTVRQHDGRDSQRIERIGRTCSPRHERAGSADDGIFAIETGHSGSDDEVRFVFK